MPISAETAVQRALPGATDHGEGVVTFALYAPGKRAVHVAGDFNGWQALGSPLQEVNEGWWVTTAHLEPGPWRYQFLIEEELLICDPYAQAIEPQDNPDLPPRAIIQAGRPIYHWRHDNWQHPAFRDLIIYEMHVGDFSAEGNYRGVIDRLDYLHDLGVNAIEFMPIYECAPGDYWGYQPTYYLAPRRALGPAEDLLLLVDEAHGRGMGIILDIVLAHTAKQHPFNQMYKYPQSPWYGDGLGEMNRFGLPMLDFRKDPTNGFVRDVQAYWLRVFHFDGFRYDYLAGVGADWQGRGLPYLMRTAREILPEAYLIGERVPELPDLVNQSELNGAWHTRCRLALEVLCCQNKQKPYDWNDFKTAALALDPATQEYREPTLMVNYAESHDEHRLMERISQAGFSGDVAVRKFALAITALMTIPGEPMVYHGQEWGDDSPHSQQVSKIHWERLSSQAGQRLHEHFRLMTRLRGARTSLRGGSFKMAMLDAERRCLAYHRIYGEADQVVVVLNFSDRVQQLEVPFPRSGHWHEYPSFRLFHAEEKVACKLDPFSWAVFASGVS